MNFQDIIPTLTQSTDIPLLTAFALGVLTTLNPCQLAINISALTYEYRNGKRLDDAAIYVLGRTISYTLLGVTAVCLVGGGRNIASLQELLSKGEELFPYASLCIGVFMLYRSFMHHHHHGDECHNSGRIIRRNGPLGNLILGIMLALAFCPESAVLYFGVLIPLSVSSSVGIMLPLIFGIGAALPVLVLAFVMAKAEANVSRFSHAFENMQAWINRIIGVLFIILSAFLLYSWT